MSALTINIPYLTTPIVLATFGVSCLIAILLLALYRRYLKKKASTSLENIVGYRGHARDHSGGTLSNQRSSSKLDALTPPLLEGETRQTTTNTGIQSPRQSSAAPTPHPYKKSRREAPTVTFEDWGRSVVAYGLDLGSYSIKGHVYKDSKMSELPNKRSVVSVVEEGIVLGDSEVAFENPGTSFFSLTRDLAAPESVAIVNDVVVHPYQALAGAMMFMVGERTHDLPPVAVCVPPYLQHIAQFLYLAANAANMQRFHIYSHSAACIASLLRQRQQNTKRQNHKPPRNVVFVDLGRSGVVAYVCEVRDSAGSVRFQTFRSAGIQNMESRMVLELCSGLDERDETLMARVIEAAKDIKEDFANVPEYLMATKKVASVVIPHTSNVSVEMTRERFDEMCEFAVQDLTEVATDLVQWIGQNIPNASMDEVELNLLGQGFRLKAFRNIFESKFDRRFSSFDKVSVSQGLAQLMVMEHPLFQGQRFDIYPLFQLPTVDELGVRRVDDTMSTTKRFSMLSPRAQRHSSQLARDRTRTSSQAEV